MLRAQKIKLLLRKIAKLGKIPHLLAATFILFSLWGFFELADEINEKETSKFDNAILLALRESGSPADPIGSHKIEEAARDLTALGGFTVLTIVTVTAFGAAVLDDRKRHAVLGLGFVAAGSGLTALLKSGFDRPRPELVEHMVYVGNASFPSGHSMMAAVVYFTLAILLIRIQKRRSVRWFILGIAIFITLAVGLSRIYLGVHWPTDVIGGWLFGAAWALLFGVFAKIFAPRPLDEELG